jgi:hypothetical protein
MQTVQLLYNKGKAYVDASIHVNVRLMMHKRVDTRLQSTNLKNIVAAYTQTDGTVTLIAVATLQLGTCQFVFGKRQNSSVNSKQKRNRRPWFKSRF